MHAATPSSSSSLPFLLIALFALCTIRQDKYIVGSFGLSLARKKEEEEENVVGMRREKRKEGGDEDMIWTQKCSTYGKKSNDDAALKFDSLKRFRPKTTMHI